MRVFSILLLILVTSYSLVIGASPYYSLSNRNIYSIVEYQLLRNTTIDVFVLNQPYNIVQIDSILADNKINYDYFSRHSYYEKYQGENIQLRLTPSLNHYSDATYNDSYAALSLDGVFQISDALFVNEIDLDQKYRYDPDFHGDSGEWLMGYFQSSYAMYQKHGLELFAGRTPRNLGILNDYSLILSNGAYSFDHYGFSAEGERLKYSFYTSRLNDLNAIDLQGVTIPIDSVMSAKRFWSIQRLDLKINDRIQIALSEATIYGGPDQQFVAAYLNPVHFFYAAQRNQQIQLNSFWQINVFYKPLKGLGLYLDLFADDIIVNNEPGVDDRAVHPDRLGLMFKGSYASPLNALLSLRYVRIWNETYTSFRTFENYIYFNKGIGFPENSYEGVKFSLDYFKRLPLFIHGELEIWRKGDRDLKSAFHDELNSFPVGHVEKGLTTGLNISYLWDGGYKLILDANHVYSPDAWNVGEGSEQEYKVFLRAQYYFRRSL